MSDKRLYRSSVNYMLTGVCGGIAEYFNIDLFFLEKPDSGSPDS